ncbi:hypothetical protein GCM10018987_41660 [Streptomyces cremeus]
MRDGGQPGGGVLGGRDLRRVLDRVPYGRLRCHGAPLRAVDLRQWIFERWIFGRWIFGRWDCDGGSSRSPCTSSILSRTTDSATSGAGRDRLAARIVSGAA